MRVVGLDLSLTSTGVATVWEDETQTWTIKSETVKGYDARRVRMESIAERILLEWTADLIVIEGPALSRNNPGTWDRAGLWWQVYTRLRLRGTPIAVCSPTTLKSWATGSGTADKKLVRSRVESLWGVKVRNTDEADALCLATMGAQHLGMDVPSIEWHAYACQCVEWPSGKVA